MRKDLIISKGKYGSSGSDDAISVKQYFFVRDEDGQKKLLLRFFNNKSDTCTRIAFRISFVDSRGRVIGKEYIESDNICINGKSTYALGEAIRVDEKCVNFKIEFDYALYGSYKYTKENIEYVEPVPSNQAIVRRYGHARRIKERSFKLSGLLIVIALMALCALTIVIGMQLAKFKETENTFTIEGLEYEFVSEEKENGRVVITGCTDKYSNILIPKEIEGNLVVGIKDGAFEGNNRLQNIRIDGVNIGAYTFKDCQYLKSVEIISVDTIGDNAFEGCTALQSVSVEAGDKNVLNIGRGTFANCTSLTSVSINQLARYYDGCEIFKNDFKIENLYLKNFAYTIENYSEYNYETSIVDLIGTSMFYNEPAYLRNLSIGYTDSIFSGFCNGLPMLESFSLTESEIDEIGKDAFKNCTTLRYVSFKNPIKKIGSSAFENTALEGFDFSQTASIGDRAFYGCSALSSLDLSSNTVIENIGSEAFSGCAISCELTLPATLKSVGTGAFKYTGITGLIFDNDTISIARGIIEGCENIVSLTMSHIPNGNLVYLFGGEKSEFSNGIPASLERITITSSLEELDNYALAYAAGLKEVSIPETVIRIGDYAFYGCSELSEINLSEDIEKLGEYSFAHTGIRAFTMPKKVASIPNGLFCGCEELEVFVTNDSLQSVGKEAFEGCLQLKSIELYNATEIGDYAFYGAGLESIVIPKTVTYIGNAILAECNSLKEITVSLDGLSVCDYFSSNSYYDVIPKTLKKIIVNNGESIESYAFEKCEYVEEIVLGEGVVYIDADFSDCIQLRKLVIPSTAEYFRPGSTYYCQKLYEICNQSPYLTFRAGIGDAVNCLYISTSMEDCAPTVETDGYKFAKYGDNWYLISWVEEKTELNLPESFSYRDENAGIEDVSAWGVPSSLFAGCDNITSVTFPKTVNSIGKYAFSDCESVVSVVFDKQAPIAAISNSCFKNCSNLINAVLPDSVIKIDLLAFFGCINLDEIDMPRALEIISTNAFCDCVSLNSITFYENVTRIDSGAFTNCRELYDIYNLSQIVINEGTSDLDEVAKNAFVHTSLSEERSVDVAIQSVGYFKKSGNKWMLVKALENATRIDTTELTYEGVALGSIRILAGAGSDCDYIEELIIGNNVWQIQENAFYGCYYLTNVDMSQNSSIKEIGSGAFKNCKRLNTVSLPSSLEIIGEGAFENCSKLLSITLPETVTLINNSAFRGCVELYEVFDLTETLLVSKDSRNGYVGAYAHKIFTSKDEGGFERFNQNGCYFIVIDDIYYLHHYTGNEVNTVIVPDTGKSIVIMPDAFHGSELSGVVLPRLTLAINSSYSEEYYIADIYYEGTEEDWSGVSCSISANLYFYSTCVHSKYEWTYVDSLPSTDRSELVWSVTKEPTCQSVGMETGVCKIEGCPYSETNEIEMVSHKIVDDQCEYCKAAIVAVNSVNMDVYPSLFNVECNGFVLNESGIAVSQNEDMGTVSTLKITVKQKAEIIFDSTISAGNNDYLYISRNGTILDYMTGINSVETVLKLSAGDYIEITFAKNSNMQIGNNCAYVSGIQITME